MKAMGIVFSNLHDRNISELTSMRTLASVPFGGRYRLIDFVLSNMVNSGVTKVGIITKNNYQSLMDHVGSGKHWDLSRKNGGLMILPPYGAIDSAGVYANRLEALRNAQTFLMRSNEDYVVMTDCDIVCNFDYSQVIKAHIDRHADITIVTIRAELSDSRQKVVIQTEPDGRVKKVTSGNKLRGKQTYYTNITVISRKFLLSLLDSDLGYNSFHKDVLMGGTSKYRIYAFEMTGYFAVIESLVGYFAHSMELLDKSIRDSLFPSEGAQIYTKVRDSAPARFVAGSVISNSMIADGCIIEGEVRNSILFRGVRISRGCRITDSIIMQDAVIGRDTTLNYVIADKNSIVLDKRLLSGHVTHPYFITKGTVI